MLGHVRHIVRQAVNCLRSSYTGDHVLALRINKVLAKQLVFTGTWISGECNTGSGIIAVTLKKNRPLSAVTATDVDSGCLALARGNARQHGVEIEFIQSDWYQNLPPGPEFDLIVSNPPYVAAEHPFMAQGDLPAEPQIALTPGPSGLEALEIIIGRSPNYLKPGGRLILEHGYDQQAPVARLLQASGFADIRCESDHNDLPRASLGRLQSA